MATTPTPLNTPVDTDFFPYPPAPGSPVLQMMSPSTIYMMTPQQYAGPFNMTYIIAADNANTVTGLTVTFPNMPMNPDTWIRVSACGDSLCNTMSFMGYAAANLTLKTDLGWMKIEFNFNATVDPEYFPVTLGVPTMCSAPLNSTCVRGTASMYGCAGVSAMGTKIPMLPPSDQCYQQVATETCVFEVCSACAAICANPNATVTPECMGLCDKLNKPDMYCSPSCKNMMIGDNMCHQECNNAMCYFDGGDCQFAALPGSYMIAPGGVVGSLFDTADANGDGIVTYEEYISGPTNLPPIAGGMPGFDAANFMMSKMMEPEGLDIVEFAVSTQTVTVDTALDDQMGMDLVALQLASDFVMVGDTNMNGFLDAHEAEIHGVMGPAFDTIKSKGMFAKDAGTPMMGGASVDDIAHVLFGIFISLSGRTLMDPPFDNKMATSAAMALADHDYDHMLGMQEAKTLGFSKDLFEAMDADMDHYLSEKEILDMQKSQMAHGCAGTVLLTDREVEVKTSAPLTGMAARKCSFLMLPEWFYPEDKHASVQNPIHPYMGSRRLLSVQDAPKAVSSSVVMTRKTGPVPNHHLLSAKAAQVPHVHHGRRLLQTTPPMTTPAPAPGGPVATEADMGINFDVTNETMPWLVSVETWNNMTQMWAHTCTGALIHPQYIIIPASCGARAKMPGDLHIKFNDGSMGMSAKVHTDPITDARGSSPAALVELQMPKDMMTTIQLHDGAGLDLSECRQQVVTVGVMPGMMYPTLTKQAVKIVPNMECQRTHSWYNRISAVGPQSVCAMARNMVPKKCYDAGDDSILLAPHPENPKQWVVLGLKAWEGMMPSPSCADRTHMTPSVWTHVAGSLNWILSLPMFGKFPSQLLSVEVEDLSITDGQMVHVVTGSEMAGATTGSIETKCSLGGTYFDDAGLGSLVVTIDAPPAMGFFDSSITLDFDVHGCGSDDIPEMVAGSNGRSCEMLKGCKFTPGVPAVMAGPGVEAMPEIPSMCEAPKCRFTKDWKDVTKDLQAHGKAFTGGLGGEAEVNGAVEYRQWMCARDWDIEEQLACNVGPGELACFRFEEMEDKFEDFGRNVHKKIVSMPKQIDGVGKEKRGLTAI